jgi:F-type H+-transporting ATPase subunit epsilon
MRLVITTPTAVTLDEDEIASVRAEDETGSFGMLPGHADLLTVLSDSVVSFRRAGSPWRYCAVRGGVLSVSGGDRVGIATQEAVLGEDLAQLERDVIARFRRADEDEAAARVGSERLHLAAIRRIFGYLRPERGGAGSTRWPGASPGGAER